MRRMFPPFVVCILIFVAAIQAQEIRRNLAIANASGPHNIVWNGIVDSTVGSGNSLVSNTTIGGDWTPGASSTESISGAGYVELTVGAADHFRIFGVGSTNGGGGYTRIDFAMSLIGGTLFVFEGGANVSTIGTYSVGDLLRVERISGGVVKYKVNGVIVYTSGTTNSGNLYANGTVRDVNASLENLILSGDFH
jgi:hypothetical protein